MPAANLVRPELQPVPLNDGPGTSITALAGLNAEQAAAATHPPQERALLLLAGAGSGKTLTLAARAAWLVQQGLDPQRLLLITFSRRAAAEMAARSGRLLHLAAGLPAHVPPPQLPWCGTFHAIAARWLREHAGDVGLPAGHTVLDRGDAEDLMAQQRNTLGLARTAGRRRFPLAGTCLAIHSRCLGTRQALHEVLADHFPWCAVHEADLARLFAAYAGAKAAQHALDFDDLLQAAWHLLQHPVLGARLRGRYDHVLVDEVQDINALQADIVHALRPRGVGLTAVGDAMQAIYAFRGAELRHILDLPARCIPTAQVLPLQRNHRSTPQVLASANAVIALATEGAPMALYATRSDGPRPRLHTPLDEAAQARGVADALLAAREEGVPLRRQAVLFRTATHSAALELELLRRDIPFVKFGGLAFIEAAHVKDVLALLRWADNPQAALARQRCAALLPGLGPAGVARLAAHTGPPADFRPPAAAAEAWAALCALLQRLREKPAWPAELQTVLDWYQPLLERRHTDARVRRADLDQLQRLAQRSGGSRRAFVTGLTLDPPAAASDEAGPPHRDEDWLTLSTMHSAKGQEWAIVHVLNVVDGCMPADLATGRASEIEEERRLLYVAMTRARDELQLWAPQRMHVTAQHALGDRHVTTGLSRFIPPALLAHFDCSPIEACDPCDPCDGAPDDHFGAPTDRTLPAGDHPATTLPRSEGADPRHMDLPALLRGHWDATPPA